MGAIIAAVAGLAILVVAVASRPRAAPVPNSSSGTGAAPPVVPASAPPVDPGAQTAATVAGIAGTAIPATIAVVKAVAGAVGGGAAATGTTVAVAGGTAGATTGAKAGAIAVGGGGAAAGGGGSAALTTVASIGAGAAAAGVGIIVGIVLVFIIAARIVMGQEDDKDKKARLRRVATANAIDLHSMESLLAEAWFTHLKIPFDVVSVRDFRLDVVYDGSNLVFQGWTKYLRAKDPSVKVPMEVKRHIRGITCFYLRRRTWHGYNLLRLIRPDLRLTDAGMGWNALFTMYNNELYSARPGPAQDNLFQPIGGILNMPSALEGNTIIPRNDAAEVNPPSLELISAETHEEYAELLSEDDLKAARFLAIADAVKVLQSDTRGGVENDGAAYARSIYNALNAGAASGAPIDGISVVGETLVCDPAIYGTSLTINPRKLKLGEAGGLSQ